MSGIGRFLNSIHVQRDLEESPYGQESLSRISRWVSDCDTNHRHCQHPRPPLPTRVIDVGAPDGVKRCRLHDSTGEHENYVTLSHCWGQLKILTTTKKNLRQHTNGIDVDALPKTFQDAIQMTRHLGVRYLWIDSLCIVQDDADDWARESAKMASIYTNSYLTLAGTSASDGSEGLAKSRDVQTFCAEVLGDRLPNQRVTVVARRARKHNCLKGSREEVWANVGIEPLMTRAWVFQERLLSRRILHFTSDEMVWECAEASECECGLLPKGEEVASSKQQMAITDGRRLPDRAVFAVLKSGIQSGTDAESQRWYQLIRNYTSLNITKSEDRLPAFSGIASTLISPDEYAAGIRNANSSTLRDLLWFPLPSPEPHRPKSYIAPSWSWASMIGAIGNYTSARDYIGTFEFSYPEPLAEIRDISTVTSTVDPFGRVKAGELRIYGPCLKATIMDAGRPYYYAESSGPTWVGDHLGIKTVHHAQSDRKWLAELRMDTVEDARTASGTHVTLLAVFSTTDNVYFLILHRRSLLVSHKFRRIGTAVVPRHVRADDGERVRLAVEGILEGARHAEKVVV